MVDAPLDPITVLSALVRIDSVNPDLVPGAAGERAIVDYCAEWLRTHLAPLVPSGQLELEEVGARDRPSLIARVRGQGAAPGVMLNAHLDTVGVESYVGDPFSGIVREGRLFGRGAFDTKSGAAAALVASARALAHGPLDGDWVLTLVADEEFGSTGTRAALEHLAACDLLPARGVVLEPSALELTVAHRGFAWFDVELRGLAAHGSMPGQGVDAILAARALLRELDELDALLGRGAQHPLLGGGAARVSTISGGTDAATVADRCVLTVERRMLPSESVAEAEADLRVRVERALATVPGSTGEVRRLVGREAFEVDGKSRVVTTLARHLASAASVATRYRGEPFWTDARLVQEAGVECVVVGADGGGAHADEEWADVRSVEALTLALEGAIRELCS